MLPHVSVSRALPLYVRLYRFTYGFTALRTVLLFSVYYSRAQFINSACSLLIPRAVIDTAGRS